MATRGRPTTTVTLTDDERDTLGRWARRHTSSQALAPRSSIVLACAQGQSDIEIAATEGCHPTTAAQWRTTLDADRLEGLVDAPPGRIGLIDSGGASSGATDLTEAVRTAVVNKRAGGIGLVSGHNAFQRPMAEGAGLPQTIQDVYLCDEVTIALAIVPEVHRP